MIQLFRNLFRRKPAPEQRQAEIMREVDAALAAQVSEKPVSPTRAPERVSVSDTARPVMSEKVPQVSDTFEAAAFFAVLRGGPLRHHSSDQVRGTEAILAAMRGEPVSWVAYALATSWHETGGKMLPNVESLNYSVSGLLRTFQRHRISVADAERWGRKPGEPALSDERQRIIGNILYGGAWGRENLGNTEPDDGWTYRGRGLAHDTGRRNYKLSGESVGVDLLANPDRLLDLDTAVRVLVSGMKAGRYTGRGFVHFLPSVGPASAAQFGQARRIINGQDKAAKIAGEALIFQTALIAGGWE